MPRSLYLYQFYAWRRPGDAKTRISPRVRGNLDVIQGSGSNNNDDSSPSAAQHMYNTINGERVSESVPAGQESPLLPPSSASLRKRRLSHSLTCSGGMLSPGLQSRGRGKVKPCNDNHEACCDECTCRRRRGAVNVDVDVDVDGYSASAKRRPAYLLYRHIIWRCKSFCAASTPQPRYLGTQVPMLPIYHSRCSLDNVTGREPAYTTTVPATLLPENRVLHGYLRFNAASTNGWGPSMQLPAFPWT